MELVFSFPRSRAQLWDPTSIGEPVRLSLTRLGWPRVAVKKSALHLAARHARSSKGKEGIQHCFLIASPHFSSDEGVVLEVDRYDPGRVWREGDGREEVHPTTLMAEDVPIHLKVCTGSGDGMELVFNLAQVKAAVEVLSANKAKEGTLLPTQLMLLRAAAQVKENGAIMLKCSSLSVSDCFEAVPVSAIPIIPTALARNLSGPSPLLAIQQRFKYGYLTMEETRKLILLLDSDPKVATLPIVGVWVSGVTSILHPQVWSTCVNYCHFAKISDRALSEDGCFLVLLYNSVTNQPHCWQVKKIRRRVGESQDLELLSGSVDVTAQDGPSTPHNITVLRLMPEMDSTAGHTIFHAALSDSPPSLTASSLSCPSLAASLSQPQCDYRRALYSSSEDKSDDEDPEPLPSPYPTTQQPPKLTRAPELSLCGSCFGEEGEGPWDVPAKEGGGEVGEELVGGTRSERKTVVDSGTSLHQPDPPSQVQDSQTDHTLHSTPAPAASSLKYAVHTSPADVDTAANDSNAPAVAARKGASAHIGSGPTIGGTPCMRGGGGGGVKSTGELHSEDKENFVTRSIVERQEKQLQALQEKVERLLQQQLTPSLSTSTSSSKVDASTSIGVSLMETPRTPLTPILPTNTHTDATGSMNTHRTELNSFTPKPPLEAGANVWAIPIQDEHSLSHAPSLQNLDLKSFAESEISTTAHSSISLSRNSRMRHFSDLSSPAVGESVSVVEGMQQRQQREDGGSGRNNNRTDHEMYQNILANVQRLLTSEPQSSPPSSPSSYSHMSTLAPHPSPCYHPSHNLHTSPHSHPSHNLHTSPHSHPSHNLHTSPHSHPSHNLHTSPHSHTSHNPRLSEDPHHFTSLDQGSTTSSAPSDSCSATPTAISDGSYSTCSNLQRAEPELSGCCQATALTHPLYVCPSPSLPEVSMLAVPRIQFPDTHMSMKTMYEEADQIALKYIQDGSQSGNVTMAPQEVSMATREYCLKYGLLDEQSAPPASNVLDITRLRGLPKLL